MRRTTHGVQSEPRWHPRALLPSDGRGAGEARSSRLSGGWGCKGSRIFLSSGVLRSRAERFPCTFWPRACSVVAGALGPHPAARCTGVVLVEVELRECSTPPRVLALPCQRAMLGKSVLLFLEGYKPSKRDRERALAKREDLLKRRAQSQPDRANACSTCGCSGATTSSEGRAYGRLSGRRPCLRAPATGDCETWLVDSGSSITCPHASTTSRLCRILPVVKVLACR